MVHLDKIDLAIINSLMQDGRKSIRQIAKEIKVSAPTVEAHFTGMRDSGIIKNVIPIFDIDKIGNQLSALVYFKTNTPQSVNIASKLSSIPEVNSVFLMTGEYNIIAKVIGESPEHIDEFVRNKIATIKGIRSVSYHMIARTVKDEQHITFREGMAIKLKCHYCENEISKTPKTLTVGDFQRYFCCNSCLLLYKDKYRGRIEAVSKRENDEPGTNVRR